MAWITWIFYSTLSNISKLLCTLGSWYYKCVNEFINETYLILKTIDMILKIKSKDNDLLLLFTAHLCAFKNFADYFLGSFLPEIKILNKNFFLNA